jgi:hypothetical protein
VNERTVDIKTICRDCIFAEFTDDAVTQVGCKLGRLDKYRDNGKATAIEDDNGLEYYEISTFCNTCRNPEWDDKFSDPVERVLKEVELKVDAVILDDSNHANWQDEIMTSVKSLLAQELRPCRIVIVCYRKNDKFLNMRAEMEKAGIKYDIVNVLDYAKSPYALLNQGVKKCRNQYYTVVESGDELPVDYFSKLNNILNNELGKFSMIEPQEQLTGLTVQRQLHQMVQNLTGATELNIVDAIKALAKEQNLEHMVRQL